MIIRMFSVFDSKAQAFLQPFFSNNSATAIRSFEAAANDETHDFNRWAADYTLFEIGEFHSEKGEILPAVSLINLGNALQFIKQAPVALREVK